MGPLVVVPMLACLHLNDCSQPHPLLQYTVDPNTTFTSEIFNHNLNYLTDRAMDKLTDSAGITGMKLRIRRHEGNELLIIMVPFGEP